MQFVKRKVSTSKSRESVHEFEAKKAVFLNEVATAVAMEDIPAELIPNRHQDSSHLQLDNGKKGCKRVELTGANDKRQITAVLRGNLIGELLPPQLIYKGKTSRCHPNFAFPLDWEITHSPRHWSTEETMLQYIENIIRPFVENTRKRLNSTAAALVIIDNFKGQITRSCMNLLESYNIHSCLLPPNSTDRPQPLDLSVNKPFKDVLRRKFDEWYSYQVTKQLSERSEEEIA